MHRPGHSPSDTVFLDESRSILLAADHLIKHISSNPLLARPLGADADFSGPRPQALVTYIASLEETRAMDLSLVLPGHGQPIVDHVTLIDERFRLHRRRAEKIHGLIASEPRTAHEIAQELWGNVAVTQAYLTLSEVLGHVDLLLADGRVVEQEKDGVVALRRRVISAGRARARSDARRSPDRPASALGSGGEPRVEDLRQLGLGGRAQAEREHVGVVPATRAGGGGGVEAQGGAHALASCSRRSTRRCRSSSTRSPCCARPSATSRAAASEAHAQSSRSRSLSAPCVSVAMSAALELVARARPRCPSTRRRRPRSACALSITDRADRMGTVREMVRSAARHAAAAALASATALGAR